MYTENAIVILTSDDEKIDDWVRAFVCFENDKSALFFETGVPMGFDAMANAFNEGEWGERGGVGGSDFGLLRICDSNILPENEKKKNSLKSCLSRF